MKTPAWLLQAAGPALLLALAIARPQIADASKETLHEMEQKVMHNEMGIDDFDDETFFRLHDANHDGQLDRDEIARVLQADQGGGQVDPESVTHLMRQMDKDGVCVLICVVGVPLWITMIIV